MEKREKKKSENVTRVKRNRKLDFRLTEEEYKSIEEMSKTFGLSKADLIRHRVLDNSVPLVLNKLEMIKEINAISSELGKSGSNLNQLAHYANRLKIEGVVEAKTLNRLDVLLEQYNTILKKVHISLREVIRKLSK